MLNLELVNTSMNDITKQKLPFTVFLNYIYRNNI